MFDSVRELDSHPYKKQLNSSAHNNTGNFKGTTAANRSNLTELNNSN